MSLNKEHYLLIRNHFIELLGGKCECKNNCGETDKNKLHIHHINGTHLINGYNNSNSYSGRGRDLRAWELFEAYKNNNLMILSKDCHIEHERNIRK